MTETSDARLEAASDELLNSDLADLIEHGPDAEVKLPPGDAPVLVSHTMQMPLATYELIKAAARLNVTSPNQLIQRWVDEGLRVQPNVEVEVDAVHEHHRYRHGVR